MNKQTTTRRNTRNQRQELEDQGFTILDQFLNDSEIKELSHAIESADRKGPGFRSSSDLFAIRRFMQNVPGAQVPWFLAKLSKALNELAGTGYFLVKSIFFDKPGGSNWFVAYHQDLTISVAAKSNTPGFGPWTQKEDAFSVQPPSSLLEDNLTLRIHLDETDETNGALRVIPGSHAKGICRPDTINWSGEREVLCPVPRGGVMIMRPLLLHASSRSTGNKRRRVIHLEFSRAPLPEGMMWSEKLSLVSGPPSLTEAAGF